ncbi:MAG: hypothetical protein J0M00_18555 [Burkholderiales bacterium]|nr:hypothetical protein [Burkholderiales bacterium]
MNSPRADLTDEEIDAICAGLTQGAAQVRYLQRVLKLPVARKPNGRPLVKRCDWERAQNATRPANGPNWTRQA